MRPWRLLTTALVLGTFCLAGGAGATDRTGVTAAAEELSREPAPPPAPVPADLELVERILRESGVETEVRPVTVAGYLAHLLARFQEAIAEFFAWVSNSVTNVGDILLWTGRILVGAAALAVALGLGAILLRLFRRRRREEPPAVSASPLESTAASRGPGGWRREIDQQLAAGGVSQALEAVWWWLAQSLAGERADGSWTSNDLVRQSRRQDLRPFLLRLDAMIYGAVPPSPPGVHSLVAELEKAL